MLFFRAGVSIGLGLTLHLVATFRVRVRDCDWPRLRCRIWFRVWIRIRVKVRVTVRIRF